MLNEFSSDKYASSVIPVFDKNTRSFEYASTTFCRDRSLLVKNMNHIVTKCGGFIGQYESNYKIDTMPFVAVDDEDEAAVVLYTEFKVTTCDRDNGCDLFFPEIKTETIHDEKTGTTITNLKIGLMGNKEIKMFINNMKRTLEYLESFKDFNTLPKSTVITETNTF